MEKEVGNEMNIRLKEYMMWLNELYPVLNYYNMLKKLHLINENQN